MTTLDASGRRANMRCDPLSIAVPADLDLEITNLPNITKEATGYLKREPDTGPIQSLTGTPIIELPGRGFIPDRYTITFYWIVKEGLKILLERMPGVRGDLVKCAVRDRRSDEFKEIDSIDQLWIFNPTAVCDAIDPDASPITIITNQRGQKVYQVASGSIALRASQAEGVNVFRPEYMRNRIFVSKSFIDECERARIDLGEYWVV